MVCQCHRCQVVVFRVSATARACVDWPRCRFERLIVFFTSPKSTLELGRRPLCAVIVGWRPTALELWARTSACAGLLHRLLHEKKEKKIRYYVQQAFVRPAGQGSRYGAGLNRTLR